LIERAQGVAHTIVGGEVIVTEGVYQGGLPGRVMRPDPKK
jgi:N-acyl-D-aspartate/D-glutamate deacylase